jgi:hypothetical protein
MSAGFYPDTSAAAFPPKSTFAFTLQVKPGKFQNPFHWPIGSAPWTSSKFSTAVYRLIVRIFNPQESAGERGLDGRAE